MLPPCCASAARFLLTAPPLCWPGAAGASPASPARPPPPPPRATRPPRRASGDGLTPCRSIEMPIRVQSLACAALLALGAALASGATAQSGTAPSDKASHWPSKPVTLVIPCPPGGTSDIVGRQLADRLREELG